MCAVSNIIHLAGKAEKLVLQKPYIMACLDNVMDQFSSLAELLSNETVVIVPHCLKIQELDFYCTALQ